jgi:peptide subunit release factor RF-3
VLRWIANDEALAIEDSALPTGARLAFDVAGKPVILFPDEWSCSFFEQRNSNIRLSALPLDVPTLEPISLA